MIAKNLNKVPQFFRQFAKGTGGSINIEAIIFLPFLLICIVTTIMFYDAYRTDSLGDKATFTIGDMLSRETNYITPDYVDSAKSLMNFLTESTADENTLRVSVVSYDAYNDSYAVEWSQVRGPHAVPMALGDLADAHTFLPTMVNGEQLIVVDTYLDYVWPLNVGFDNFTMEARAFTRPRFAPQLVWLDS